MVSVKFVTWFEFFVEQFFERIIFGELFFCESFSSESFFQRIFPTLSLLCVFVCAFTVCNVGVRASSPFFFPPHARRSIACAFFNNINFSFQFNNSKLTLENAMKKTDKKSEKEKEKKKKSEKKGCAVCLRATNKF